MTDICSNYHKGADTSVKANPAPIVKQTLQLAILQHLFRNPDGLTCEEVENDLGLKHQTCSARITELLSDNKIMVGGYKPTSSGRKARVYWFLTG